MLADELEARLDERFLLLTGGSRAGLPRQQTLRAMVDWSWELLTSAERAVLAPLSLIFYQSFLDEPFFNPAAKLSLDAYEFVLSQDDF